MQITIDIYNSTTAIAVAVLVAVIAGGLMFGRRGK